MKRKKLTAFILSATMLITCCGTAFAQDDTENMPIEGEVIQETAETTEAPEDETAIAEDWIEAAEEPTSDEVETALTASKESVTVTNDMDDTFENGYYTITGRATKQVLVGESIDLSTDIDYTITHYYEDANGNELSEPADMANDNLRIRYDSEWATDGCWDYVNGTEDDLLPVLKRTAKWEYGFSVILEQKNATGEWEYASSCWVSFDEINYQIAFTPYYEGGGSDTWLFTDEEVILKLYNPDSSGFDLPDDCIVEWNLYSFDNEGNYIISTQTTNGDLYFTPTQDFYSITANVYYMDSDTDSANLIASCEKAYGVIENGYQEFYAKADIDQGEFNYTIKPGETINLIGYSVTYSTSYPNGYTAEAEIANVDVYANYIPTIDEDGDEDWVFDKTDEARYSIVSINGTKVTGVSYGEAELTIIFKDANGNNVDMGYSLFIDVDPVDSDSATPATGTGSSPTATNNGNSAATTGTNNIDSTTTTVADSTSNASATTAVKTSDVNYMRYAVLLLAAFGAVTILCMRERKETN